MKNGLVGFLAFTAGAAIGSVITWKLVKDKYKKIADEEIDSVKETWKEMTKMSVNSEEVSDRNCDNEEQSDRPFQPDRNPVLEKPDLMEYAALLNKERYSNKKPDGKEPFTRDMDAYDYDPEPYVIIPEHFDEYDDFETECLLYWSDGVLTDEDQNPISDIDGTVGADFAEHIGDFEPNLVHIRNERYKTDYEILAVLDAFEDSPDTEG